MSPAPQSPSAEADVLVRQIDRDRLPRHVAVIMDGNGRWARGRGLPRVAGHRAGIQAVRDTVTASAELGVEVLTVYAFSRQNWSRPRAEVATLMRLLREYVDKELRTLQDNGIRFRPIGRIEDLSRPVRAALDRAQDATRGGERMTFNIALSYGGRDDILEACRALAREVAAGRLNPAGIDAEELSGKLSTAGQPDPDLLIRTSGELRVSNFLLWQIAYAEIWVTPTLWPDFRREHLYRALIDYQARERRYGGVGELVSPADSEPGRRPVKRILTGAVLVPVVLFVVLWGSPELLLVGLLLTALPACLELGRMLAARGRALQPATATVIVWLTIVLFLAPAPAPLALAGLIPLASAGVALVALREAAAAADAALSTSLCALWVGVGLGSLLGLRVAAGDPEQGRYLLLFCLLVIWVADSAAYYGGKRLGRRRLSWVSPGKTWEGSGFGLVGGLAAAAVVSRWVPGLDLPHALGMGAAVTVAGMIGDLAESVQKRAAGLKDSGTLLPGHGGVLDRVDALLFAGPVAYAYAYVALWR